MIIFRFLTTAAASFAFGLAAQGALALDATDFTQKLTSALKTSGMAVEIGDVTVDGEQVTISSLTVTPAGGEPVTISTPVVMTGVRESGDGGYAIAEVRADAFSHTDEESTLSVAGLLITEVNIPANASGNPMSNLDLYRHLEAGPIRVEEEGAEVLSITSIVLDSDYDEAARVVTADVAVEGIHSKLDDFAEDEEAMAFLTSFGLETIDARLSAQTVWNIGEGVMTVTESTVDIANVGQLSFTSELHGYDEDLVNAMYEMQLEVLENPDATEEEKLELSDAMLAKMGEELELASVTLRFDDNSITNKVLTLIAEQNGTSAEVMAQGFMVSLPMMAAQFGAPPAIQEMLLAASQEFFAAPQSLEISIAPDEPVMLGVLLGVLADPAMLVSPLNFSVVANQ